MIVPVSEPATKKYLASPLSLGAAVMLMVVCSMRGAKAAGTAAVLSFGNDAD